MGNRGRGPIADRGIDVIAGAAVFLRYPDLVDPRYVLLQRVSLPLDLAF